MPGKFKAAGVNTACDSCQAGKYQATVGATSESDCTSCPGNANAPQGSAASSACACNAGYTGANGESCASCTAGKYKESVGAATCSSCPSDSISAEGSTSSSDCIAECAPGWTGPAGSCTQCPAGKFKADFGPADCDSCQAGKFKAAAGVNIACDNCVPGKFKAAGVNTACDSCQAGKYQATVGAGSESDCASCPGNANAPQGSAALSACACNAGYTGANGESCASCTAGKYKEAVGAATCSSCPSDSISAEGSTSSSDCIGELGTDTITATGASPSWPPATTGATHAVKLSLSLPLSVAEFNPEKQAKFKAAIARAAGASPADVAIDNIEALSAGRSPPQ